MKEVLLLKCGEIVLKGLNRRKFEDRLMANLKRRVEAVAKCPIEIHQSVIYVWIPDDADGDADGDGITNLLEYTHDLNPQEADPWPEITILWPQDGQEI